MRTLYILLALGAFALADRPRITDDSGNLLIKLSDLPIGSCGNSSQLGLGFMDGKLEECSRWILASISPEYEEYKCKNLRVPGTASVKDGRCTCNFGWEGPVCENYQHCKKELGFIEKAMTPWKSCNWTMCRGNGSLAVGPKGVECVCRVPWDGPFCNRLSCWRMVDKGDKLRYHNNGDRCKCAPGYSGEDCQDSTDINK